VKPPSPEAVTALLRAWSHGDEKARDRLLPLVYADLRRRAARFLRRERPDHTLQPTALVHEAYMRLVGQSADWQNRSHFFGVASEMMRRVLVDHARARRAARREGDRFQVTLDEGLAVSQPREVDLVALDAALEELAALDARQGRMVELRFFGGLSLEETAEALGVSLATVKRDWHSAKAWLFRRMTGKPSPTAGGRDDA